MAILTGYWPATSKASETFAAVLRSRRVFGWLRRGLMVWRMALAMKRKLSGKVFKEASAVGQRKAREDPETQR
jgi:hypothetical protein